MAEYSRHNLAATLEARVYHVTLPCVPRPRPRAGFMPLDPDYAHIRRHEWTDENRGRSGGTCLHCHRILSEVRLRVNPQQNTLIPNRRHQHTALARLIANTAADVPPVHFVEAGPAFQAPANA